MRPSMMLKFLVVIILCVKIALPVAYAESESHVISDWVSRYDAEGNDICDTDPLNDVCSCPCDSSLIMITQKFGGGEQCLGNGLSTNKIANTNTPGSGLSANTCAKVGLIANENGVCGSGRVCLSSSNKCDPSDNEVDGLRCFKQGVDGAVAYTEARDYCSARGMRLCSMNEVHAGVIESNPDCNMDNDFVWTSTKCEEGCGSSVKEQHYYVTYARPSSTPFGQPRCLAISKRNFNINGGPNRFIYPACCADRSDDHSMAWNKLQVDDVKRTVHNSNKCSTYVQNTGWTGSIGGSYATDTLAYQAQGTGYNDPIQSACSGLTKLEGMDCREMHGPFLRRTPSVEKTFTDISGSHASLKVGIRIWANDMWSAGSGPVSVEVLDGATVLGSYSLDRSKQLSCDSNWNTYYNTDGGKGFMFEPGKPAWSTFGGGTCFKYVTIIVPHSGSTVTVRVKSTLSTNNPNPSLTAGPGYPVAYEYYAFDLLQIWSSPDPPIDYSSIDRGVYRWGSVDTRTVIKGYKRNGNTVTTELNLTNGFVSLDSNWWQCTSGTETTPCPGRDSSSKPQSSMALQIKGTMITSTNCGGMGNMPNGASYCQATGRYKEDYALPDRTCTPGTSCTEIHGPFEGLTSTANPVNKVSQTFQIPTLSGTTYRIRARLWAADSWNTNEHVYVHVQDPDNPSLEPAPQVVAEGYNCVWNRPPATSDVEPASASINKWQKYADSIFNPYEQNCFGSNPRNCYQYTRPCYVDVEFSYYSTAKKLKISFGSNIDQGVMSNVGNGQLNEYWGFSGLEIDADIPTSTGCPGSNCSVGSCVKWPGSFETAIGYGYCDSEQQCSNKVYTSESDSTCQAAQLANQDSTCVPAPRMVASGTIRTQCKLCNEDFWCSRGNPFPTLDFIDPLRSNVSDPVKDREITRMKITAYGSMGSDGIKSTNNAVVDMNGLSLGNTLLGRGASSNWRCNDCFESGSIELDEGTLDGLGSNKYTYYNTESSNAGNGNNSLQLTPSRGSAWCLSSIKVRLCARPGKAKIVNINGANGVNKDSLSPTDREKVVITGFNLGPVLDTVTYGPDGEGYTVSPEECTIDDKISFTQITCTVRPGIGTNHRWKIKTNKVEVSDASSVTTSYRSVGVPYVIPTKVASQGETARLTGNDLHLDLLQQIATAQAGVLLQTGHDGPWVESPSAVTGNVIEFNVPPLTTKNMARVGHAVKVFVRVIDPILGQIGDSESVPVSVQYNDPALEYLLFSRESNISTYFTIGVGGRNFGGSTNVGVSEICNKTTCFNGNPFVISWSHTYITWLFSLNEFKNSGFPGNVTLKIGNATHYFRTNTLAFDKDPPTIVNDTHLEVLADVIFPTVGGRTFDIYVKNLALLVDGNSNDKAKVKVHVGDDVLSEGSGYAIAGDCLISSCRLRVTMPAGQGTNIPIKVESDTYFSNTVIMGGYEPPAISQLYLGATTFGTDANGEYDSLRRPGIEARGQIIQVKGENFGETPRLEFCSTPRNPCTGSRVFCCEGLWQSSDAVSIGTLHRDANVTIPAGAGYDHLVRLNVAGQTSNAIAIRYVAPMITQTFNQSHRTSGAAVDSTPGDIVIHGIHFGAPNSATSGRYGDPIVQVGTRLCIVRTWTNTRIQCILPAGEGANLIVHVTSGGQKCSTDHVGYYSYAPPVITSFTPQYGSTDGTTLIDVIGLNFGTNAAHVSLEFVRTAGGTPTGHKYTSIASTHNHLSLSSVRMPEGQGGNIAIQVNVSGQISAPFIRPAIANINIEPYSPTLISLQPGEMYLPPFLSSISPNHGPTSGCDIFEDLSVWKQRYLVSGGGGRQCSTFKSLTISGFSLGLGEAEIQMKVDGVWKLIASDSDPNVPSPKSHTHTKLVFDAPSGVGKNLTIRVSVGGKLSTTSVMYSFDPPTDLAVTPMPFSAQSSTAPIEILATNGFGEVKSNVNVSIGAKVCAEAKWHPVHRSTGRPYIACQPSLDFAGSKSFSVDVAGFTFDSMARSELEFNKSIVFSVCTSGETNISTGVTKTYYGRPCMGNLSTQRLFHRSAPCVDSPSGKGELCVECPAGAFCFTPGTPWAGNKGEFYTYLDPQSKQGFWRLERAMDGSNMEDEREAKLRIDDRRWDPTYRSAFPSLHQKDFVFDFVACEPAESCEGANKCSLPYREYQEQCQVWNIKYGQNKMNCTTTKDCQTRADDGASGCDAAHPENCAVCNMDVSNTDGVGTCMCIPSQRCGGCTRGTEYPDGTKIKSYFKLDGECAECPENVPLLIVGFILGIAFLVWGASWMNGKDINTSVISIGVDYFQVLAIFRNSSIPWPPLLSEFYRFFAIFNFNIDIAAPECLAVEVPYAFKFFGTQIMPIIALVLCILVFLCTRYGTYVVCREFYNYKQKPDWKSFISTFLILVYFLYLMVVRRALQIFTCNPLKLQSDGFLYTTFSSPECPYGLCRCYDPNRHEDTKDFYQAQFRPWAIAALIVYGAGFPLLVFILIMMNKRDIKTDQILHAHKIGNSRELSTKSVWSTRVKYKHLYYYFKPGKVYWILWIIYRKLAISIVAVLFYSNPGFQLAFTILILFSSYVLQVRNRPYMSPMERNAERNLFHRKVEEGSANHVRIKKLIDEKLILSKRMAQQAGQNVHRGTKKLSQLHLRSKKNNEKVGMRMYLFDYNSVELVMLGSAICVCSTGIMFTSGNFVDRPDLQLQRDLITFAIIIIVIASLCYLTLALLAEIFGDGKSKLMNSIFKCVCRRRYREERLSASPSEESFTIATNPLHAVDKSGDQEETINQLQLQAAERDKQNKMLLERLKKEKKNKGGAWNRSAKYKKGTPEKKGMKKKQFAQMTANLDIHEEL